MAQKVAFSKKRNLANNSWSHDGASVDSVKSDDRIPEKRRWRLDGQSSIKSIDTGNIKKIVEDFDDCDSVESFHQNSGYLFFLRFFL